METSAKVASVYSSTLAVGSASFCDLPRTRMVAGKTGNKRDATAAPKASAASTANKKLRSSRNPEVPPKEIEATKSEADSDVEEASPQQSASVTEILSSSPASSPGSAKASPTAYISPLERLKKLRADHIQDLSTIASVEDLQVYIRANATVLETSRAEILVKGRLVWTSSHVVKTGDLARLHLVDLQAPESLEAMQAAFRSDYEQDFLSVDQLLITATIFGVTAETPGIPPEGSIVTIRKPAKLRLFMDKACQLTTKLNELSVEAAKNLS